MPFIQEQSPREQTGSLRRIVRAFREFAKQEFDCDLYDYQVRIAEACLRSLFVTKEDVAIAISRQSGKCLAKGTPVLMYDGSIRPAEEIQVGDRLMGDDSTPRTVLSLARGRERMWRVQPNSKGHEPYVVNESHILTVACRRTGRIYDRPLRSILSLKQPENCVLGVKVPVSFPDRPVPLNPYWLGLWLGDGNANGVGITNADPEVVEFLWNYAGELGMNFSVYPEKNASDTYAITKGVGKFGRQNPLVAALRELNVFDNKHVPDLYRANSDGIRLNLLAGLIDSDGHKSSRPGKENVCEFVFVSKRLALDVQWVARSLGFRSSISLRRVNGADYWRVMLYGELWRIPTRVTRKKYVKDKLRENPCTYGFTLVDQGIGDYYGFEIDGNKRFLLGDCTATHNTESVTLLVRFLLIFHKLLTGVPLMCGIASPKGEQAKTDVDRVKKSIVQLRNRWQVEDREFNAATVRAYRNDDLFGEIFKFSLAPTTSNESKTLNLLIVEEGHLADDAKRSNELDPMLASTGGVTFMIGVGCTRICDFYRAKNGELAGCVPIVVPVDEVIRDRRKKYEETGDPRHLEYEKAFQRELRKKGAHNPELRRNYYLEDQVEAGNFISRERLLSCGRVGMTKDGILIPCEDLTYSIDWARTSDYTWSGLTNRQNDLIWMWKYPHVRYEEQIGLMLDDLKQPRTWKKMLEGQEVEEQFTFFERITTVKGDSTGLGDFPMEYLQDHSGLPMDDDSRVKFTAESKNDMYCLFEAALFREPGDPMRHSYPSDHPLAPEYEEQMCRLVREYKTDRELLSPHAPEEPGAYDDACSMAALGALGASVGAIGELLVA